MKKSNNEYEENEVLEVKHEVVGSARVKIIDQDGNDDEDDEDEKVSYVIKLHHAVEFEGETYHELDISNIENARLKDMKIATKTATRQGASPFLLEMSQEYAIALVYRMTKTPLEFFDHLHAKDIVTIKNRVTGFLYGTK